jgi:predicted nucleic acid-binding protein
MPTIYLDVCCLNRPFDDQTQDRVRLEAEAVLTILKRASRREWEVIGSEIVDAEIAETEDLARRSDLEELASSRGIFIEASVQVEQRARDLARLGFSSADPLHLACAESAKATVLLTTDDRLLKRAKLHAQKLHVHVENPLTWLTEEMQREAK